MWLKKSFIYFLTALYPASIPSSFQHVCYSKPLWPRINSKYLMLRVYLEQPDLVLAKTSCLVLCKKCELTGLVWCTPVNIGNVMLAFLGMLVALCAAITPMMWHLGHWFTFSGSALCTVILICIQVHTFAFCDIQMYRDILLHTEIFCHVWRHSIMYRDIPVCSVVISTTSTG